MAGTSNNGGADVSSMFDLPDPDFDVEAAKKELEEFYADNRKSGPLRAENAPGHESVEEEIARQIEGVEKEREAPLTDEEKEHIANRIRTIREGAWREGLKAQLVGKKEVPIEYFNRLDAEYEATIPYIAQTLANYGKRAAAKDQKIEELEKRLEQSDNPGGLEDENSGLRDRIEELTKTLEDTNYKLSECQHHRQTSEDTIKTQKDQYDDLQKKYDALKKNANAGGDEDLENCRKEVEGLKRDLAQSRETGTKHYDELQQLRQEREQRRASEATLKNQVRQADDRATAAEKEVRVLAAKLKLAERDPAGPRDDDDAALRKAARDAEARAAAAEKEAAALRAQLAERGGGGGGGGEAGEAARTELAAEHRRLQTAHAALREEAARGAAGGAAHLRAFWEAVEATRALQGEMATRLRALTDVLGLTFPADDATTTTTTSSPAPATPVEQLDLLLATARSPQPAPPVQVLQLRLTALAASHEAHRLRTLEARWRAVRDRPSEREVRARLRRAMEPELARRVAARTDNYREHRRALCAHIYDAYDELARAGAALDAGELGGGARGGGDEDGNAAAAAAALQAYRARVDEVREQFLAMENLPEPRVLSPGDKDRVIGNPFW
ncbi:hypothetical protein F4780DRAFT_783629 [Xylariomycetidae sp. FL0641]|nr:hypothetical protein F4780DRAFT_783629 [Xylariomycetidae sp. FL0641]